MLGKAIDDFTLTFGANSWAGLTEVVHVVQCGSAAQTGRRSCSQTDFAHSLQFYTSKYAFLLHHLRLNMGRDRTLAPNVLNGGDNDGKKSLLAWRKVYTNTRTMLVILLLFLNYFIAQYDKFVLSYFQIEVIRALDLTTTQYGLLSGYATGIVAALAAVPVAFIADYSRARLWTLSAAAVWWNICVLLQGYCHRFWQIFLARLGMSIGQAPVEALSISLISDLVPTRWLFLAERCDVLPLLDLLIQLVLRKLAAFCTSACTLVKQ